VQNLANWQKMRAHRTAGRKCERAGLLAENTSARDCRREHECVGLPAENASAQDCRQKCKHTEPSQLVENVSVFSYLTRSLTTSEHPSPLEDKDGHRGIRLYRFLMPAPMVWERRARKWRWDAGNWLPKPLGYNSSVVLPGSMVLGSNVIAASP
jgi:hypothetical protein